MLVAGELKHRILPFALLPVVLVLPVLERATTELTLVEADRRKPCLLIAVNIVTAINNNMNDI